MTRYTEREVSPKQAQDRFIGADPILDSIALRHGYRNAGNLEVDMSMGSASVVVNSGGTLSGYSYVGDSTSEPGRHAASRTIQ